MEFKVIWSPQAIDDLEGLTRYIARNDPKAAERLGFRIIDRVETLAAHPLIGLMVGQIRPTRIRKLLVAPFWIFYSVRSRTRAIEILRVWHAARQDPPF